MNGLFNELLHQWNELKYINVNISSHIPYLYGNNDDLEDLQAQFKRFPSFGMILITWTHEKIFQFPT